ncbi:hypothetical protein RB3455 [Rhodopirellula baltica SH 1]|uniref:Uncharacterized protein n=1 Tax=Rhodopirellula baltica (strain DSM 10527 / NCIMB 13988 / SH1) TaxID=243090 RepID=Q7UU78_RHOBA|nr:hypothetical protein RB3455 [Rhodopirellula baltica SH 1]
MRQKRPSSQSNTLLIGKVGLFGPLFDARTVYQLSEGNGSVRCRTRSIAQSLDCDTET